MDREDSAAGNPITVPGAAPNAFEKEVDVVEITVNSQDRGATIVLRGVFDANAREKVLDTLGVLLEAGHKHLTIDLSGVSHIDTGGLSTLLLLREKCAHQEAAIVLEKPQEYIAKILNLCGLDRLFEVK